MEGVDDGRDPRRARGQPPQQAGLRRVGVDDLRPPGAHQAHEAEEGDEVAQRRDLASEAGHRLTVDALLRRERQQVALPRRLAPDDEPRVVAEWTKTVAQEDHVEGRTPDVQAGEQPEHTHPPR